MKIRQIDLGDVLEKLPEAELFKPEDMQSVDLVICTLGFEDRTSGLVTRLSGVDWLSGAVLLMISYPTNKNENSAHLDEFRKVGERMKKFWEVHYSRSTFQADLAKILDMIPAEGRVLFDVSTCSSYVFYPAMRSLSTRNFNLTVGYAEANVYCPTEEEWLKVEESAGREGSLFVRAFEDADFQSSGVEDVYTYAPFSEMNSGNRASSLVAVPNFNPSRMNSMVSRDRDINKTAFKDIVWILGEPPSSRNNWRVEAIRRTNSLENVDASNLLSSSTLSYKEMIKSLESIWQARRYSHQISIASLGSKMQHLGTFIFLMLHQEVGLWLAEPAQFRAARFSEGVGSIWCVQLGHLSQLKAVLSLYMTFQWRF